MKNQSKDGQNPEAEGLKDDASRRERLTQAVGDSLQSVPKDVEDGNSADCGGNGQKTTPAPDAPDA